MKVETKIPREYATIAIMHALGNDESVSSDRKFRRYIKEYLWMNGGQTLLDHECEYMSQRKAANNIVNKYFK